VRLWPWRKKASTPPVDNRGGWFPLVKEPFTGAWQRNLELRPESVLAHPTVYACVSLIAADIGKLRVKLVAQDADGIWSETESNAFSPVLRKPNRYQTRIKFFEQWVTIKLIHGNTYVLKQRDARGVVVALYLLDPKRVTPLVAEDGAVYYRLCRDDLSGVSADDVTVPAREIIHDVAITLHHPLIGVSPLSACGLTAAQGLAIQRQSARFFANSAQPGGILTAPAEINDATAARLKAHWEANYTGENAGKVAVLGDGLKYEPITATAADSQLIEQLKWAAETVCSVFHMPPYKVSIGPAPNASTDGDLNQEYYSGCLQSLIESIELLLDEGLELPRPYGTEFDIDGLLRMNTAARYRANSEAIGGGWFAPNEARRREGLAPVEGGDSPLIQVQNYSLAALAKRDQNDPFITPTPGPKPNPPEEIPPQEDIKNYTLDVLTRGYGEWKRRAGNAA
jgi:HK97 family phage portal protein